MLASRQEERSRPFSSQSCDDFGLRSSLSDDRRRLFAPTPRFHRRVTLTLLGLARRRRSGNLRRVNDVQLWQPRSQSRITNREKALDDARCRISPRSAEPSACVGLLLQPTYLLALRSRRRWWYRRRGGRREREMKERRREKCLGAYSTRVDASRSGFPQERFRLFANPRPLLHDYTAKYQNDRRNLNYKLCIKIRKIQQMLEFCLPLFEQ